MGAELLGRSGHLPTYNSLQKHDSYRVQNDSKGPDCVNRNGGCLIPQLLRERQRTSPLPAIFVCSFLNIIKMSPKLFSLKLCRRRLKPEIWWLLPASLPSQNLRYCPSTGVKLISGSSFACWCSFKHESVLSIGVIWHTHGVHTFGMTEHLLTSCQQC